MAREETVVKASACSGTLHVMCCLLGLGLVRTASLGPLTGYLKRSRRDVVTDDFVPCCGAQNQHNDLIIIYIFPM